MKVLLASNDAVEISFVRALLADAGIDALVLDDFTAGMEGSIGAIPRRIMVADPDIGAARDLLRAAGIGTAARADGSGADGSGRDDDGR